MKDGLTQIALGDSGSTKPRLLDLFCGAGGCSVGYERAGFEIALGVDVNPQPHYPFHFWQDDAIEWLREQIEYGQVRRNYDAIHASPPCQDHMETPHAEHGTGWLLEGTRELLKETGLPWVIENVPNRRKQHMRPDYTLCGCMFGLPGLRRERWFETSWGGFAMNLDHNHTDPTISVVGHGTPSWVREKLGRNPTIHEYRAAMGIDWMNRDELSQAIPPAYTEFIGAQLLEHIRQEVAA